VRKKNRIACPRTASADRQLCDIGSDPPRLALGEQLRRRAPTGLVLEIDAGERLSF
jgi:hypothetical protein